jgi:hypothetical protein
MKLRDALQRSGWLPALVASMVFLAGCSADEVQRPDAGEIEFGIWVVDALGEVEFIPTDLVPNVEGQACGWRVWEGDDEEPVKWIESMTLPVAPESWEGVAESPNVVVSADGRTSTMIGVTAPVDGYAGNTWSVTPGDPPGDYEMEVELGDGRKVEFRFRLGEAEPEPEGAI